jgi:hypothetical protein
MPAITLLRARRSHIGEDVAALVDPDRSDVGICLEHLVRWESYAVAFIAQM